MFTPYQEEDVVVGTDVKESEEAQSCGLSVGPGTWQWEEKLNVPFFSATLKPGRISDGQRGAARPAESFY